MEEKVDTNKNAHVKPSYIANNNIGLSILIIFIAIITIMLLLSIVIPDKTISEKEKRTLATFPKFSFSTLFNGEFFSGIEDHYSDTFPFRDWFLSVNEKIDKYATQFSSGSESEDDVVVVTPQKERDMGGESIEEAERAAQ